MGRLFELSNSVNTFTGSRGVCGAMVCAFFQAVKAGKTLTRAEDIGYVGSFILAQNEMISASSKGALFGTSEADDGKLTLFKRYGLSVSDKVVYRYGSGTPFSKQAMGTEAMGAGYHYISCITWDPDLDDASDQHAIGVAVRPGQRPLLLDANLGVYDFDTPAALAKGLAGWFDDNHEGLSYPVDLVNAVIYHLI